MPVFSIVKAKENCVCILQTHCSVKFRNCLLVPPSAMDTVPKLTGDFGMSKPKDTRKAGSATSGKASGSAPVETGDTAAYLDQLMREADEAGGFDGSSLMMDILQHRLVWFLSVAHYNEKCLFKTTNDLQVLHRTRIVLDNSRDRRPAPPEVPKEVKATPPPLPAGTPMPPPAPAPVNPAKAMVLNPPPAKAKVTEPTHQSRV